MGGHMGRQTAVSPDRAGRSLPASARAACTSCWGAQDATSMDGSQPVVVSVALWRPRCQLGPDQFLALAEFLSFPDVVAVAGTCRQLRGAAHVPYVWRRMFRRDFVPRLAPRNLTAPPADGQPPPPLRDPRVPLLNDGMSVAGRNQRALLVWRGPDWRHATPASGGATRQRNVPEASGDDWRGRYWAYMQLTDAIRAHVRVRRALVAERFQAVATFARWHSPFLSCCAALPLFCVFMAPSLTALLWAWHMDGEYGVQAAYVGLPGLAAMTLVGMSLVAHWVVVSWDKWRPPRRERGSRRYPRIGYAHELAKHDLVEVLVAPFLLSVRLRRMFCTCSMTRGGLLALIGAIAATVWLSLAVALAKAAGLAPVAPVPWAVAPALLAVPSVLLAVAWCVARGGLPRLVTLSGVLACLLVSLSGIELGLHVDTGADGAFTATVAPVWLFLAYLAWALRRRWRLVQLARHRHGNRTQRRLRGWQPPHHRWFEQPHSRTYCMKYVAELVLVVVSTAYALAALGLKLDGGVDITYTAALVPTAIAWGVTALVKGLPYVYSQFVACRIVPAYSIPTLTIPGMLRPLPPHLTCLARQEARGVQRVAAAGAAFAMSVDAAWEWELLKTRVGTIA